MKVRVGSLCVGGERTFVVEHVYKDLGNQEASRAVGLKNGEPLSVGEGQWRGEIASLFFVAPLVLTWGSSC